MKINDFNMSYDKYDIIYIFMLGGLIGTSYEVALNLILRGVIEDRSGSILTPFNYVYGIGAIVILLSLNRITGSIALFISGSFLGGIMEYVISVIQEYLLRSRSWDYSDKLLNINGRTTIPYMLFWGILGYVAIRFILPKYIEVIHRISCKTRCRIAVSMYVLMTADLIITVTAIIRYSQRADGIFYDISFIKAIDRTFDDGFMQLHFPNMMLGG